MTGTTVARLSVRDSHGHRVIPIDKPIFAIGRGDGNDLVLTDGEVSRHHADILGAPDDGFRIRDCQSEHGTFVNGESVVERALVHRDQIECGRGGAALLFLEATAEPADVGRRAAPGEFRQIAALLESLRAMGSERVLDQVLTLVLDAAIDATGAERGFIMLADRTGVLEMTLARRAGREPLETAGFRTSRKIPEEVFATGRLKVVEDLFEGDLAQAHNQTVAFGIRHVLCVPLRLVRYVEHAGAVAAPGNIGVLYLDSRERGRLLAPSAPVALEALATEAATAIENARLYRETLAKARLDEELRMASRIQQALLPAPRRLGAFYEAVGASVPSRVIGGDFFDYLDVAGGGVACVLGDVTGKGPPAALVAAAVQGIIGAHVDTVVRPASVLRLVNRVLLSRHVESRFATIFLAVLTPDGRLCYCNAGQNPPLLFSDTGVERLEAGGTLLGAFPEATYEQAERRLRPGDTVVLFSDGVVEALSAVGEEFGEERVRAAVHPIESALPERVLDGLLGAVRQFTSGAAQNDDVTAVVLRYRGMDERLKTLP